MKEITTTIFPVLVVFTNFFVLFLCLPRKKSFRFTLLVFGAIVAANFAADIIIAKYELNDPTKIIRAWIYLPFIIFLFKGLTFQKVFAYFAPMTFAATLTLPGEMLVTLLKPFGEFWYWLGMLVVPTIALLVYVLLVWRFGRGLIERLFSSGTEKEWSLYALSAVICFIVLSAVYPGLAEVFPLVLLLIFFIGWFLIILCFAIINTHEKSKQKYEAELSREIISSGRDYYDKLTDMTEKLHIMRHDYKHHLATMQQMIVNTDVQDYLRKLRDDIDEKEVNDYCASRVINALLDSFCEQCKKADIEFEVKIILPPVDTIDDYELCIILGNLLENAVTACLRTPENERRYIEISMRTRENQYGIKVENSYDGVLNNDGKTLYTIKKDGGLGIKSIMSVARKHHGEYVPVWDEKKFSAYVVLKLN
ncbi:MAG: GHKL domain-containing protein [Ruminococcus sp.]|jgi:signal transduction histidine kinase|nr:GHKL domain-containing protein [Ruminococcus sp.]